MYLDKLKIKLENNPHLKKKILDGIIHPVKVRPRLWIRLLQFIFIKKGKGSVIYKSVRKDIVPFNKFEMGNYSVVEDFCTLNNSVGNIIIGNNSRIGLANTIIGPVEIGNNVNLGQNVILSGLNHNYDNIELNIDEQGITKKLITIQNNVLIGANSVILAGVTIGTHSYIGAGSIVTKSVEPYTLVAGNPARAIKRYDFEKKEWIKL